MKMISLLKALKNLQQIYELWSQQHPVKERNKKIKAFFCFDDSYSL